MGKPSRAARAGGHIEKFTPTLSRVVLVIDNVQLHEIVTLARARSATPIEWIFDAIATAMKETP